VSPRVAKMAFGIVGALLVTAGTAPAQQTRLPELSLGYEFQRFSGGEAESFTVPKWANVDLAYPITGVPISIVGQFDFGRRTETRTELGTELDLTSTFSTYGFGVRWNAPRYSRIRPFAQFLGGAQRFYFSESLENVVASERDSDSGTDALLQVGGGIAFSLTRKWNLLWQTDYRRIFADQGINNLRFVAGFRLGIE
jgi:hypothetical protein